MTWWSRNTLSLSRIEPSKIDRALHWFCLTSAVLSAAIVLMIVAFLLKEAWPAITEVGLARFVRDEGWFPDSGQFNLLPMIVATLLTTLGAVLIAGPLGIASAVFYQYYAPRVVASWFRRLIELLSGIPSVVFGFWGLVVLAPLVSRWAGSGQCLLTATVVLALMVLPTVALTSMAALKAVPSDLLNAAAALGIDRTGSVWRVALPSARKGIAVGVLLAVCRALGETMAVLMLAGNIVAMPDSLLSPVRTLTANIALEMGYATQSHRSILFVSGLFLMLVVAFVVGIAGWVGRAKKDKGQAN